jgi:hypothetical protein
VSPFDYDTFVHENGLDSVYQDGMLKVLHFTLLYQLRMLELDWA